MLKSRSKAAAKSKKTLGGKIAATTMSSDPTPKEEYMRSESVCGNSVADLLNNTLCWTSERAIQETVAEALGGNSSMEDSHRSGGWVYDEERQKRRRTNEECATWIYDLSVEGKADLRRPLPPQVAKWLREVARKLINVASEVETITDDRNLDFIKKVIAEPDYIPSLLSNHYTSEIDWEALSTGEAA